MAASNVLHDKPLRIESLGEQVTLSAAIYYLAFGLYSIGAFFELTSFVTLFGVERSDFVSALQMFALALLFFKFLTQRASILGWICVLAAVAIGYLSWRQGNEGYFFWLVLFIVCSDGIEIRVLASITLAIVSVLTIFTVLCCNIGIIENRAFARADFIRYAY